MLYILCVCLKCEHEDKIHKHIDNFDNHVTFVCSSLLIYMKLKLIILLEEEG